jgi:GAF domain-containing protein/HAMP domain-containing protein
MTEQNIIPNSATPGTADSRSKGFQLTEWIVRLISFTSILFALLFFVIGILLSASQVFILAGVFLIIGLISLFSHYQLPTISLEVKVLSFSLLLQLAFILVAAFFTAVWIEAAVINLVLSIYFASTLFKGRLSDVSLFMGFGTAILASVLGNYSPFAQVQSNLVFFVFLFLVVISLGGYLFLVITNRIQANLRLKLIITFLAIALVPLIIAALIQAQFLQTAIQAQTNTALNLAANQVSTEIDSFITTNLDSVTREAQLSVFTSYFALPANERPNSPAEKELASTISVLRLKGFGSVPSYGILNLLGDDIFDTNPVQIGQREVNNDYFLQPNSSGTAFASTVEFSPLNGNGYLYFSAPIRDVNQQIIGILRLRYDALVLQSILEKYIGLVGQRSYPILVDENYIRIADAFRPDLLYKSVVPLTDAQRSILAVGNRLPPLAANASSTNLPAFATALKNYQQSPFFRSVLTPEAGGQQEAGAIVKLTTQPWYVAFVEEQAIIDQVRTQQTRLSSLIATLIAGLVGAIGAVVATTISNPIISLTKTAEKVSNGDLDAKAVIRTRDEISTLADTFNLMTNQLKGFITSLEDRVRERTQQLAEQNERLVFRSRQLQTVADVARGIAQTQELEPLLNTIVSLISNRFGFYHVGIFLLDDQNKYAVLRAANSEGGKRMLARQHRLEVGQVGIVGYVTGAGKPRIATDVGADAVYFKNPDLPKTRSEMSLPLMVGEKIIGALDVQSTEPNAFTQEDTELFATLADQVAIALYNNQLYQTTRQSLEESQTLHRQYLQQEWVRDSKERKTSSFMYTPQGIISAGSEDSPEVKKAVKTGEPVIIYPDPKAPGEPRIEMVVPIRIRGEVIGVIRLRENTSTRTGWSTEEINTIKAVADQIGLALETARLFEQTVRRADRERKVLEITSKIRSTTNTQQMMKIAMDELQRVLNASHAQVVVKPSEDGSSKETHKGSKK